MDWIYCEKCNHEFDAPETVMEVVTSELVCEECGFHNEHDGLTQLIEIMFIKDLQERIKKLEDKP